MTVILCISCYILGVAATLLATRPFRAWNEGYECAKEFYSDWHRGFDDGWDAAITAMKSIAEEVGNNNDRT